MFIPLCAAFTETALAQSASDKVSQGAHTAQVTAAQPNADVDYPVFIKLEEIQFNSDAPLPPAPEKRLKHSLSTREIEYAPDWLDEVEDYVKDAWRHYGYFQVNVTARANRLNHAAWDKKSFSVEFE